MLSGIVLHAVPMGMCMTEYRQVAKHPKETEGDVGVNDIDLNHEKSVDFVSVKNKAPEASACPLNLSCSTSQRSELCGNRIFLEILLTLFLFNFGACVAGVFLPHFIRIKDSVSGVPTAHTISCISMLGAGDLCGRFMSGVLGNWLPINKLFLIFIDTFVLGIGNILIPFCQSYMLLMVCTFVAGTGTGRKCNVYYCQEGQTRV